MDSELNQPEKVQRIIALKRFEQPPPGYFHLLPDRIITRIEHGEGRISFWEKWLPQFTIRPSLAYAFGLTVCGAVTASMIYSPNLSPSPTVAEQLPAGTWAIATTVDGMDGAPAPSRQLHSPNWLGSTNPVSSALLRSSLFAMPDAQTIPASYIYGN